MSAQLSKNQILIRYLAERCGRRLGRTRLVKAAFLADYQSRRHLGKPISSYEYKYHHHGPWTQQVPEDVKSLEALGLLEEHREISIKHMNFVHSYTAKGAVDYSAFSPDELFIIEAVADRCSSGDIDSLLDKVYATPPMQEAKKVGKGARIPMEMVDSTSSESIRLDPARIERAEWELDSGLGRRLDEALDELRARHFADS